MKRTNKPIDVMGWVWIAAAVATMVGLMLLCLWGVVELVL